MESVDHRDFKISVLQAVIFTPDLDHTVSKVMSGFYPQCAKYFDADPQVLPNAPGFPPEVPRIIMRDKSDLVKFEIAASRINFIGRSKLGGEPSYIDIDKFYSKAVSYLSLFKEITDCRIGRLAAIRTLYANHEDPGLFLSGHFCKSTWNKAPLNRPENFELHSHKTYELSDKFNVNSWARNKTGFLTSDKQKTKIVLFEQDLNTLAEDINEKDFSVQDTELFFKSIIPEFDSILSQYYPIVDGE
jgi:hypothetical protein